MKGAGYAELHCLSNFSFQRCASSAGELFERAKQQGYSALAITDECTLSGIVRAHEAAQAAGLPPEGREAARIAARVLKGERPSCIPIEQPKKIEFIINLKEATDMGLKVPFDILTSATKVIK